jgi:FxsC-like protein
MAGLRASADGYGPAHEDWRPFLPQTDEPAVAIVRRALAAYGLPEVTARQLPARPETGPPPARPARSAVLLVDPWLASSLSAETLRTELAGWSSAIGAVVVVMARGDAETTRHTAELRAAMLARITHSGLQAPHHEAGSAQGLAHTVIGAVADMLALGPGAPAEPLASAEPLAPAARRPDAAPRSAAPDAGRRAAPDPAADRPSPGRASRAETSTERLNRRRRERSSWLSPVAGLLPPLLYGTSGGKQAET